MVALSEFDIIKQYFSFSGHGIQKSGGVLLGVGDDAAILPSSKTPIVIATDTLIEGVHFPKDFSPQHLASRALGVNISDFAAMGVKPTAMTMALSLPSSDSQWLAEFSKSLAQQCEYYGIALIGGDTTKSPCLSVSLTLIGNTHDEAGSTLRRSAAQDGDDVWVTGSLGKGAAALALLTKTVGNEEWPCDLAEKENLIESFNMPQPRLDFGVELLSLANAAIDISDGLLADAQHIAEQSQSQLSIMGDLLPLHPGLRSHTDPEKIKQWVLSGGDDYELLFTAAPSRSEEIVALSDKHQLPCRKIGTVENGHGVKLLGNNWTGFEVEGYQHF